MIKKPFSSIRICLAQINPVVGDMPGNAGKIASFIKQAKSLEADMVIFPELSLSGYPPEDLLFKSSFIKDNEIHLKRLVKESDSIVSIIGYPHQHKGRLYNAAAVAAYGRIIYRYHKMYLPNFGVFDEKRYFSPGREYPILTIGKTVRLGINICRDIWEEEGSLVYRSQAGRIHVIINISSSPYQVQKHLYRTKLVARRARQAQAYVVYCNMVGGQDELIFDGGSFAVNPHGTVIARGKQFEEDLVTVDIPVKPLRSQVTNARHVRHLYLNNIRLKQKYSISARIEPCLPKWEEIYQALVLGLKDYAQKNKFKKVVLGLSGGIDSSLAAVIAVDALGSDNVIGLTMPSMYSSKATQKDACLLAENIGIEFKNIGIIKIFNTYTGVLKKYFKGYPVNCTEENLQARIRGNILMAFSNKFNWLVLTTGNKSEISVGYCTLYGDTAGGFSVLKDVPKTWVYHLTTWRNSRQDSPLIPLTVLTRPPTAELKPNQKDQDVLPPYTVLDNIIEQYIERRLPADDIRVKGLGSKKIKQVIEMIDNSEYKRRQSPPGIKITPLAFGKERRMPITHK